MTSDDIRAAIAASPELQQLVPDTVALAAALSAGRAKLVPTEAGKGDILGALGFDVGNALCDMLDTVPQFRHAKHLLADGRMRVDLPLTLGVLQSLVGAELADGITFTQAHATALQALALRPDPVSEFDVRRAIFADDGTLRV